MNTTSTEDQMRQSSGMVGLTVRQLRFIACLQQTRPTKPKDAFM